MKLRYIPNPAAATSGAYRDYTAVNLAQVGTDSNSTDLGYWENSSASAKMEKGTVITLDPSKPFQKYFDFKKLNGQQ